LSLAGVSCAPAPSAQKPSGKTAAAVSEVQINGAGASFPAPLYVKWFKSYGDKHPGVQINYQSIGSGGGVKNMIDKTVDFGASDAAMSAEEMAKVDVGVQCLPMTAGSIVLGYNIEGVASLKLSREAYVGIFLGKIAKWNDPAIAATNKEAKLPDQPINVVVRADGSGTSFVFTKHLSEISKEFAEKVGTNKSPKWPAGIKQKGNEGITAALKTTPGSIGYLEYGYAKNNGVKMASLQNKVGKFVEPNNASGQAALAGVKMPGDLIGWLPDPEGDASYPIVTYTWVLCYKKYADADKLRVLKDVLTYGLTEGQKSSEELGYIPLPENVVKEVMEALKKIEAGAKAAT